MLSPWQAVHKTFPPQPYPWPVGLEVEVKGGTAWSGKAAPYSMYPHLIWSPVMKSRALPPWSSKEEKGIWKSPWSEGIFKESTGGLPNELAGSRLVSPLNIPPVGLAQAMSCHPSASRPSDDGTNCLEAESGHPRPTGIGTGVGADVGPGVGPRVGLGVGMRVGSTRGRNQVRSSETTGGQPKIVTHSSHFCRTYNIYSTLFK